MLPSHAIPGEKEGNTIDRRNTTTRLNNSNYEETGDQTGGNHSCYPRQTLEALLPTAGNRPLRDTVAGTKAEGQLNPVFFAEHRRVNTQGVSDFTEDAGTAHDAFDPQFLPIIQSHVSDAALNIPILFTDHLSNNTPAVFVETSNPNAPRAIIINARLRLDPEFLTDTLVEEVIHAQQSLDGADIQADKRRYAYKDSPLEQAAKAESKAILGYAEEDTLHFQQHSE